jgi:predicted RNase H-like HicB family nuclease
MSNAKTPQAVETETSVPLTFLSTCEEGRYTILCLELDIASCGATLAEAEESLRGLIELYIADCLEGGETRIPLRPVTLEALLEFL